MAAVFGTVYTGDVLLSTALGVYQPATWSTKDWAVEITDKMVQTQAMGAIFDHVIGAGSNS